MSKIFRLALINTIVVFMFEFSDKENALRSLNVFLQLKFNVTYTHFCIVWTLYTWCWWISGYNQIVSVFFRMSSLIEHRLRLMDSAILWPGNGASRTLQMHAHCSNITRQIFLNSLQFILLKLCESTCICHISVSPIFLLRRLNRTNSSDLYSLCAQWHNVSSTHSKK